MRWMILLIVAVLMPVAYAGPVSTYEFASAEQEALFNHFAKQEAALTPEQVLQEPCERTFELPGTWTPSVTDLRSALAATPLNTSPGPLGVPAWHWHSRPWEASMQLHQIVWKCLERDGPMETPSCASAICLRKPGAPPTPEGRRLIQILDIPCRAVHRAARQAVAQEVQRVVSGLITGGVHARGASHAHRLFGAITELSRR